MRLTTWNVNGIRNPFSYPPWNTTDRSFPAMFDILGADIIVMQELKIQRKDLRDDMVLVEGWDAYFSLPKHKKGYSGVGIYTRNAVCAAVKAEEGVLGVLPSPSGAKGGASYCDLPAEESVGGYLSAEQIAELGVDPAALDAEGRCLILEFPAFVLFGVYAPANSNGQRDDFRHAFHSALDTRIRNLIRAGKRVVLVGDLNVSRDEQDTASAVEDCRKAGLSHGEYISTPNRRIFNQLLVGGEVVGDRDEGREEGALWDTTRGFHPARKGMFTHWEQKINARPGNYGSRIDFVLVSEGMKDWIKEANIQEGLLGSDHCPVFADFHEEVVVLGASEPANESEVGREVEGEGESKDGVQRVKLLDIINPPSVFEQGVRKKEWRVADAPAFSAKKLPEFEKRRSIRSMFAAPAAPSTKASVKDNQSWTSIALPNGDSTAGEVGKTQEDITHAAPSPSLKRKASSISAPAKKESPLKRQKSEQSALRYGGQQQSLKGFFSARSTQSNGTTPHANNLDAAQSILDNNHTTHSATDGTPPLSSQQPPTSLSPSPPFSPSALLSQSNERTAEVTKWSSLFSKPVSPLCEVHAEPCKTMQTKKKGSNQGRSFWMCARPLGPTGEKIGRGVAKGDPGGEWRCGTFIWCSDWGSGRNPGGGEAGAKGGVPGGGPGGGKGGVG